MLAEAAKQRGAEEHAWVNRLILEGSPYLQQHAHNPVDWFPWGEEALKHAAATGRPILLSVGYATCHWCHVMERESFEDPEIAAAINAGFVAIKVDREERPDLDDVYMAAVQATNQGHGGWPMTLVLTPDGRPLFAGTYLPPDRFRTLLDKVTEAWEADPDAMTALAADLSAFLAQRAAPATPGDVPTRAVIDRGADLTTNGYDTVNGGFGGAPKFPRPVALDFLLRLRRDAPVVGTLRAMARGGIHDPIGGGFHRYATDAAWRVPHFEKMLYDNAQLLRTYTAGWQATDDPELSQVAERTAAYLLLELRTEAGAFASATDADSLDPEGVSEEGRFFTWTRPEVLAVLGHEAGTTTADSLGIGPPGNLEGRSVPWREDPSIAVEPAHLSALYAARAARPAPILDHKVVTAWNGLAASGLARAGVALDRPEWVQAAEEALSFLQQHLTSAEGRLSRTWSEGQPRHDGTLEDYAFVAEAHLDVFEATANPAHIDRAVALVRVVEARFADPSGGWYRTADDAETLVVRPRPSRDAAEPSGASVLTEVVVRLADLTGDDVWLTVADRALAAWSEPLRASPASLPALLGALDRRLTPQQQVIVVHPPGAAPGPLWQVVRTHYLPDATRLRLAAPAVQPLAAHVPWVSAKLPLDGEPTAYVCERGLCQEPTTDPERLETQLRVLAGVPGSR